MNNNAVLAIFFLLLIPSAGHCTVASCIVSTVEQKATAHNIDIAEIRSKHRTLRRDLASAEKGNSFADADVAEIMNFTSAIEGFFARSKDFDEIQEATGIWSYWRATLSGIWHGKSQLNPAVKAQLQKLFE